MLARAGYRSGGHRAHQITAAEIRDADLVIAMEDLHLSRLRRLAPDAGNLALLTDFDPDAASPAPVCPTPGTARPSGFDGTLAGDRGGHAGRPRTGCASSIGAGPRCRQVQYDV